MMRRLRLISPFRWRLEWLLLVALAAAYVLDEQARAAIEREPFAILRDGLPARASVLDMRLERTAVTGPRRQRIEIAQVRADLQWRDRNGEFRRVTSFLIPPATATSLALDPDAKRWPPFIDIVYLMEPAPAGWRSGPNAETVIPQHPIGTPCQPRPDCSLMVLDGNGRADLHDQFDRMEAAIAYGPAIFLLALVLLITLLALRLSGIVYNEPSLR